MPPRRVGILGGSFNPAHSGHLHIAGLALKRLRLDSVWWMVSPQNPLKPERGMAPFADRLAGARRLASHPRFTVTAIERDLGTVHSVDTLRRLRDRFPTIRFVWLIGADILIQLPYWKQWRDLFAIVPVAVFARPPYSIRALSSPAVQRFARMRRPAKDAARLADLKPPAWVFLHMRGHPASATQIRAGHARNGGSAPRGKTGRDLPPY